MLWADSANHCATVSLVKPRLCWKKQDWKGILRVFPAFIALPRENAATNLKVRAHQLEAGHPLWQDCCCSSRNTDIFIGSLPFKKQKAVYWLRASICSRTPRARGPISKLSNENTHRHIGLSATDVFIMPAEYRLVNPGTQQSADSSSQRPRWLRRLHLKITRLQFVWGGDVGQALAKVRGLRQKPSCTRHSLRPNTLTTLSVVLMHHSWPVGLNDFSEPWRLRSCYVFVWLRSHMFAFATVSRAEMTLSGGLLTLIFDYKLMFHHPKL